MLTSSPPPSSSAPTLTSVVTEFIKISDSRPPLLLKEITYDVVAVVVTFILFCFWQSFHFSFYFLLQKIGSRIKIFQDVAPRSTDRVIQVLGSADHCVASVNEIVSLTKGTPIRGTVHLYDPIHFAEVYGEDYGGYGTSGGVGGGTGGGGARSRGGGDGGLRGNRERFNGQQQHHEEDRRNDGGGRGLK